MASLSFAKTSDKPSCTRVEIRISCGCRRSFARGCDLWLITGTHGIIRIHLSKSCSLRAKYAICGGSLRLLCREPALLNQVFEHAYQIAQGVPIVQFLNAEARVPNHVIQWQRRSDDEGRKYTAFCSDAVKDRVLNDAAWTQHMQLMQDAKHPDVEGSHRGRILENRMYHLFATATVNTARSSACRSLKLK